MCIVALVGVMDLRALEERIAPLEELEDEWLGLNEEIQRGDLRLQEFMNERVWLREKTAMVEVEVKKL